MVLCGFEGRAKGEEGGLSTQAPGPGGAEGRGPRFELTPFKGTKGVSPPSSPV